MRTISITSNDLDFIEKIYNDISVINCKNNVSVDISNWEDDDEDKICGIEKWITFGDMINMLLEDDTDAIVDGEISNLKFACKNFKNGEFIMLDKIDSFHSPYFVKFSNDNGMDIYNPSFEEMFNYMWKEV